MRKTYCDICGKEIPEIPPYVNAVTADIYPIVSMTIMRTYSDVCKTFDLCRSCSRKIVDLVDKEMKK